MIKKLNIRPMNSLLFVSDPEFGIAPTPVWGALILSTPSCISFACYPEQDGPTEVTLGRDGDVDPGVSPVFEGDLDTPHRAVTVTTVDCKTLTKMDVPATRTHVRIWYSHPRWPERVVIGLS
jgi:hypothetical protein